MAKYKIGEIAKDFGVKVTDVADILTKYFGEGQYKHSTVLESDRLDVLFDHFTQAQGFGTLQEYFDTYDEKIRAKKAKEAEESAKAEASEKKEEAAPVQAQPKEEKKEEKPVAEVKAEAKTENKAEVKAEKPSAAAPAPAAEKKPEQTHEQKDRKPQQKQPPPRVEFPSSRTALSTLQLSANRLLLIRENRRTLTFPNMTKDLTTSSAKKRTRITEKQIKE